MAIYSKETVNGKLDGKPSVLFLKKKIKHYLALEKFDAAQWLVYSYNLLGSYIGVIPDYHGYDVHSGRYILSSIALSFGNKHSNETREFK